MLTRSITALAAVLCLALAFVPARRATEGLSMPYDMDHFREVSYARSLADGHLLRDPFYKDETIWYNPLLAATVATLSRVIDREVPDTFVQAGPFLSALAQLAFFAATARLVGPWPALIALAVLLFSPPHDLAGWAAPSVTPWIFSNNFASTFFYLGLFACCVAIERRRTAWWAVAGASLGFVFLGHTAPALILGLCAVASVLIGERNGDRTIARTAAHLGALVGTALVVSSPFLYSIVGRYGLRIANADPLNWVWDDIAVSNISEVLQGAFFSPIGLLRVLGVAVLIHRARTERGALLVLFWMIAATLLFAYGYLQQLVGFGRVPSVIPQFHFYFHLKAIGHVLAGVAAWAVVTSVVAALARWPAALRKRQTTLAGTVALMGIAGLVVTNYDAYQMRPDFQEYQREALGQSKEFAQTRVLERLRAETPLDAVVLATPDDSYYRVAPAGRAVVAIPASQSNPYVPQGGRDADQEQMLSALLANNLSAFNALADKYGVTHVLLGPADTATLEAARARNEEIREVSRRGGYVLYARTTKAEP